jgi:hypothetical protein
MILLVLSTSSSTLEADFKLSKLKIISSGNFYSSILDYEYKLLFSLKLNLRYIGNCY